METYFKKERAFVVLIILISFTFFCNVNAEETNVRENPVKEEDNSDTDKKYTIIATNQTTYYNGNGVAISSPDIGDLYYGQDANYKGVQISYTNNGDGTITDNNTGLMWQKNPGDKVSYDAAVANANSFNLAGYTDWRVPTIKELYSLILFSGLDPSGAEGNDTSNMIPFIDSSYFDFEYGNPNNGERIIDSQYVSATKYVHTTMNGDETVFGVNFADGRIKGYGTSDPRTGSPKKFFLMYVRGNTNYGINNFENNIDGTISDKSTGLMWLESDSGSFDAGINKDGKLNWQEALEWGENIEYAGYSDWRIPNAKELQSLVDYTRSPVTSGSAAINPMFSVSIITDEGGNLNYPYYWTNTTHINMKNGKNSVYISFGEALGWMQDFSGNYSLLDVHGAGAQRSDPKSGDASLYPYGHGPQGDVIRVYNYARCVRNID